MRKFILTIFLFLYALTTPLFAAEAIAEKFIVIEIPGIYLDNPVVSVRYPWLHSTGKFLGEDRWAQRNIIVFAALSFITTFLWAYPFSQEYIWIQTVGGLISAGSIALWGMLIPIIVYYDLKHNVRQPLRLHHDLETGILTRLHNE
jgi:hypothetical protein